MCFSSLSLSQDLDRIAEANELFDAVLTGSVDQDKKVGTKVPLPTNPPVKERANSITAKNQGAGNSMRKLSLYIGNFPWVSTGASVSVFSHVLTLVLHILTNQMYLH